MCRAKISTFKRFSVRIYGLKRRIVNNRFLIEMAVYCVVIQIDVCCLNFLFLHFMNLSGNLPELKIILPFFCITLSPNGFLNRELKGKQVSPVIGNSCTVPAAVIPVKLFCNEPLFLFPGAGRCKRGDKSEDLPVQIWILKLSAKKQKTV